ncbi:UDP-glucose 6-dehydrogenase 1 [Linum perenne]
MEKPTFVFDGRNVVDAEKLRKIGFIVYAIGKPLDAWLKDMPVVGDNSTSINDQYYCSSSNNSSRNNLNQSPSSNGRSNNSAATLDPDAAANFTYYGGGDHLHSYDSFLNEVPSTNFINVEEQEAANLSMDYSIKEDHLFANPAEIVDVPSMDFDQLMKRKLNMIQSQVPANPSDKKIPHCTPALQ